MSFPRTSGAAISMANRTEADETQAETAKRQADVLWKQMCAMRSPRTLTLGRVQIAVVVSFYFVTSISLVFLNKILLSGYDFPYPLFITWCVDAVQIHTRLV